MTLEKKPQRPMPEPIGEALCGRCGKMHPVYAPGAILEWQTQVTVEEITDSEDRLWLETVRSLV